jgi:geranylgeranyl pyrophosphate synthase
MEKLLSPISCSLHTALESLAGQLGTYFQIRDDYKNLTEEVDTFLCGQFEPRLTLAV